MKHLAEHFTTMSNALDIKSRTQLVNAKITYAVELQSVMRELLTEVNVAIHVGRTCLTFLW